MPGIAHKDLTDPQIHEPKGASTASTGSIIFSDGAGGTVWKVPSLEDLEIQKLHMFEVPASSIQDASTISTAGMSAITDGILVDAANFTIANKNVKELAAAYNTLVQKFNALLDEHEILITAINTLTDRLVTEGLLSVIDY